MSQDKIEAYFEREQPFRDGIRMLRDIVLKTDLQETMKWGAPVYTLEGKNVLAIISFKNHFGIWFYNGVFLSDPDGILASANEKTKGMRHIKFQANDQINSAQVKAYVEEAVENQRKGRALSPERNKRTKVPLILQDTLAKNKSLKNQFQALTPYKQREFCEYIDTAKQDKTKISRLEKILPMIEKGIGLHDKYRK